MESLGEQAGSFVPADMRLWISMQQQQRWTFAPMPHPYPSTARFDKSVRKALEHRRIPPLPSHIGNITAINDEHDKCADMWYLSFSLKISALSLSIDAKCSSSANKKLWPEVATLVTLPA
jgi:hypothetical protein